MVLYRRGDAATDRATRKLAHARSEGVLPLRPARPGRAPRPVPPMPPEAMVRASIQDALDALAASVELGLSDREREVLQLASRGMSNAQIGRDLFLSEDTIKTHLRRVFRKVGARSRTEAVMTALRAGAINPKKVPAAPLVSYREAQVLQAVADGLSNADIAVMLDLSFFTVKSHLARLAARFGTGDRTRLAVIAYHSKLVR